MDDGEQWVIVTTFRHSDDKAYWGKNRRDGPWGGLTPYRGNAFRYESEAAALHIAYGLRDNRRAFDDFTVEKLPPKPPLTR